MYDTTCVCRVLLALSKQTRAVPLVHVVLLIQLHMTHTHNISPSAGVVLGMVVEMVARACLVLQAHSREVWDQFVLLVKRGNIILWWGRIRAGLVYCARLGNFTRSWEPLQRVPAMNARVEHREHLIKDFKTEKSD